MAAPLVVPVGVGKVKMSGNHWVPCVDAVEGVEEARGGQS